MADDVIIHPTASVDPRAVIGEGSRIWINVQIREQVGLGATVQGWTVIRAIDKVACGAAKKP